MSKDDNEVDQFFRLLRYLDETKNSNNSTNNNNNSNPINTSQYKVVILAAVLASIIPICSILYGMGQQREQLVSKIDTNKLEITAAYTDKLSQHKQYLNDSVNKLNDEIRRLIEVNNNLKKEMDDLNSQAKEMKETIRNLQMSVDSQYRTITWLRSQHGNMNIPTN